MKNTEHRFEEIVRAAGCILAYILGGVGCYRLADLIVPDFFASVLGLALFCILGYTLLKIPSAADERRQEEQRKTCEYLNRLLLNGQYHNPYSGSRIRNTDDLANYLLEEQHHYYRHLWPPEGKEPKKENDRISPEDMISAD